MTYSVPEDEVNPLFAVAVGNEGAHESPLNRIQEPSDSVNALVIGAYTYNHESEKVRSGYSCVGAGREGAKTKSDILEFGGSMGIVKWCYWGLMVLHLLPQPEQDLLPH